MKKHVVFVTLMAVVLSFILFPAAVQGQEKKAEKEVSEGAPLPPMGFLDLSPEQKAKLEEFRKMRREERKEFLKNIEPLRQRLESLLRDPNSDAKEIDALIDQISKLQSTHFKKVVQQRREIRKIFTPEQLEKLEKFRSFARERFLGRRGFFQGPRHSFWRRGVRFRGWLFRNWWRW